MLTETHYSVRGKKVVESMRKDLRPMTIEEAKGLRYGDQVIVMSRNGKWANAKVNGNPKVWKTRPGWCDVSLKYGMYEYFTISFRDGVEETSLVVEIEQVLQS